MKKTLEEIEYLKSSIKIVIDNKIVAEIVKQSIRKNKSQAMNMCYFFILD